MSQEEKNRSVTGNPLNPYYYGTFQGVANYYPPPPGPPPHLVVGYPQPTPPHASTSHHVHFSNGYQTVSPSYGFVEGRPVRESRLPCCGLGMGWFLFLIGFFLGGIPWYVGTFIVLCVRVDYREKPGYVACVIVTILAIIAVTLGVTKGSHSW